MVIIKTSETNMTVTKVDAVKTNYKLKAEFK